MLHATWPSVWCRPNPLSLVPLLVNLRLLEVLGLDMVDDLGQCIVQVQHPLLHRMDVLGQWSDMTLRNHWAVRLWFDVPICFAIQRRDDGRRGHGLGHCLCLALGTALALGLGLSWDNHLRLLQGLHLQLHELQAATVGFFLTVLIAVDHEMDPLLVLPGVCISASAVLLAKRHHLGRQVLECEMVQALHGNHRRDLEVAKPLRQGHGRLIGSVDLAF